MPYYDPTYIILIPALILAFYAQWKVNSTYNKYSKISNFRGLTAAEVARRILDSNGLNDIQISRISGKLTDNFNPKTKVISLSDSTYNSTSVAAVGVAAHECGHAIQYATGYFPIFIRSALVPVTGIGSSLGIVILLVGFLFSNPQLAFFGVLLFSATAVFQAVTLPVEFNASSRALKTLEEEGILESDEIPMAKKVLSAAALTYVAALVSSLMQVARLAIIAGSTRRKK